MSTITFPVGYRRFHRKQLYNFQMNRPYSLGYARAEDFLQAGPRIRSFSDWRREMCRLAETAESEHRDLNAAFYYRAAEFYTLPNDPDKDRYYDRFNTLFYRAFQACGIHRVDVPYRDSVFPAMILEPDSAPRGTVVIHGGFDSFIEEFVSMMLDFRSRGYRVVGFDGPGQGAALRRHGLLFHYRWEEPVGALLDHLDLTGVTLIGLSLGGWLAVRAAAFEPRIHRLIVTGHAYDYRRVAPAPATWLMEFFRDYFRNFTNRMSLKKVRQGGLEGWSISQLMYILGVDEPMAALDFAFSMTEENLHSEDITQDVLVLAGRNDHFIPFRLYREQMKRLSGARSVTGRVFTRADHAHNHCQIGNIRLALDTMQSWLDRLEKTGEEPLRSGRAPAGSGI